ncbi:MAG: FAD-binding oxidoreductase, partial [Rhodobacteraceae bacterium]|nr:FAD-binding oxidoreductase [Paracoccaceae bacterium]
MLDFVIIGGGVAGLSAAAALAPGGSVLLLEGEETLGYHASGRSAALYEADYGAPATVALARASEAGLKALGVLSPRGLMLVGKADEADDFAREAEALCLRPLTPAEAVARVPILNPDTLAFAAATETAQDIDTDLLLQTYARTIRAAGGEIRTHAPVTAIARVDGGWRVTAGGTDVTARRLVNAAGAWADRIAVEAGLPPIGIQPLRRSIAQLPAPAGLSVMGWPMIFAVAERWYLKP